MKQYIEGKRGGLGDVLDFMLARNGTSETLISPRNGTFEILQYDEGGIHVNYPVVFFTVISQCLIGRTGHADA